MNTLEQIARAKVLKAELETLDKGIALAQRNCRHSWGEAKYAPDTIKEPHFLRYEGHGSDPEPIYTYSDKSVPRWSQTCSVCGKVEFTKEQKAVKMAPAFPSS